MTNEQVITRIKHNSMYKDDRETADYIIKALEQQKPLEKFENAKDHICKLASDYKCWDNRLSHEESLELCNILKQQSDDCVSRADLKNIIGKLEIKCNTKYGKDSIYNEALWDFVNEIKALPPVTPTRKVGKWIRVDHTKVKCSNCDITHLIAQYPHGVIDYCPNCGSYNQSIIENER